MRADILRVVTREMQIADFDPEEVADRTTGLTGSDLRMVLREAVLGALTEDRMTITQQDVMEAVEDFEERDNLKNMDMIDGEGGRCSARRTPTGRTTPTTTRATTPPTTTARTATRTTKQLCKSLRREIRFLTVSVKKVRSADQSARSTSWAGRVIGFSYLSLS